MRRGLLLATALLGPVLAAAQTSPDEQARRLLEDGRAYWAQGKHKQALDNFNTIVAGFSGTDSLDDALLEVGRYQAEIEGNLDKARQTFDEIAKRYPQSDSAPGAYYYLGRLTLDRARTSAELDDALAQFTRVQRLYPRSDWVPRTLHAAGLAHRKAGRLPDAIETQRRVSHEYPTSDSAAAAQFQVGHCLGLLGEARAAMEEYQQVRNRFPEGEWAAPALDRITALYRFVEGGRPAFTLDAGFGVGAGDVLKDVRAILMTPQRTLHLASDKVRGVVPFDKDGKMGPSIAAEELRSLSLGPRGEVVVAARLAVRLGPRDARSLTIPGDKPGEQVPLDRITAALATQGGELLVADEKRKHVYRFGPQTDFRGAFPDGKERQVERLAQDTEGGVVLLDTEARTIQVFDETGKPLRGLAPKGAGYELRKPLDVAVDASRNYYVADEEQGVLILSPEGKLLATLGSEDLRRPRALTLDPAGAILVYSEKAQRVVRYK